MQCTYRYFVRIYWVLGSINVTWQSSSKQKETRVRKNLRQEIGWCSRKWWIWHLRFLSFGQSDGHYGWTQMPGCLTKASQGADVAVLLREVVILGAVVVVPAVLWFPCDHTSQFVCESELVDRQSRETRCEWTVNGGGWSESEEAMRQSHMLPRTMYHSQWPTTPIPTGPRHIGRDGSWSLYNPHSREPQISFAWPHFGCDIKVVKTWRRTARWDRTFITTGGITCKDYGGNGVPLKHNLFLTTEDGAIGSVWVAMC